MVNCSVLSYDLSELVHPPPVHGRYVRGAHDLLPVPDHAEGLLRALSELAKSDDVEDTDNCCGELDTFCCWDEEEHRSVI